MDSEFPDVVRTLAEKQEFDDELKEKTKKAAEKFKAGFIQTHQNQE
jgi:hypothetical protein